jgi:3-oxoacyl-(acyl-carrier-protein) synthase/phosphopantetheinyl transferase
VSSPIAVVGIGAVFPGAGTAHRFWRNIRAGVDAITDVPPHRWDPALYYDPGSYQGPPRGDRFYCRRGGFVDDLAAIDPLKFGIMPAALPGIEPDQLLALRTAAEAIADAGGDERLPDRSRIGVVVGRGGYITPGIARFDQRIGTVQQLMAALADLIPGLREDQLAQVREAFCARLGGADRPDASIGLVPSFAASRIANRFDLRGPAYTVDAACASALVAVEHAVRALRGGQCDAMLAGAVHHAHHVTVWSLFSQLRALSRSERIRPFDRAADGTLLSEGTGMVLLKRLVDAQHAGDRIYAVIRGIGTSSDGRASSLMSPLADGQLLAVHRAWRDAGLDPREPGAAGLIEAHGTAAPAGDEVELETLRRVFGTDGPPIGLGTVKSMIGHALPAGGIAGLIKAVLALHDGVLPPTLNVTDPHPALAGTRLRLVHELAEWEPGPGAPRRAVVNAFGFGGANAHLVLEEPAAPRPVSRRHPVLPAEPEPQEETTSGPPLELPLDLGTPLVRLDGAVQALITGAVPPPLPAGSAVAAEFDALLREASASAQTVIAAMQSSPATATELTTSRVFSLEAMPYLIDHCAVSQPPGWADPADRFPVVPLATLLEVMAETARELLPDLVVIGFDEVRALRWVVAAPATTAMVHAKVTAPGRVEVAIEGHAGATVLLAARYPAAPPPDRTPLPGERPAPVSAERLYAERWMFHGPAYQGVTDLDAVADDGIRARLRSLPTPGALLDSAGQVCGHWAQVTADKDQSVFPAGIDRVRWYGPPPPAGERLSVTVWTRSATAATVRADMELVGAKGRVRGRIEGWTAHRFSTDESLARVRCDPGRCGLGQPQDGGWCLVRRHWDGSASRDWVMRTYLSVVERAEYERLAVRARDPWLLGRIAAKDAVRNWLWARGHGSLYPVELTVRDGVAGRPEVTGPFDEPLHVSLAHTATLGVAIVRPVPEPAGIDLEAVSAGSQIALAEPEQALLDRLGGDRATAATRLWTAKEAAARAAGSVQARDFRVTAADGDRLLVASERTVTAVTTRELDGHIVTWTVASQSRADGGTQ